MISLVSWPILNVLREAISARQVMAAMKVHGPSRNPESLVILWQAVDMADDCASANRRRCIGRGRIWTDEAPATSGFPESLHLSGTERERWGINTRREGDEVPVAPDSHRRQHGMHLHISHFRRDLEKERRVDIDPIPSEFIWHRVIKVLQFDRVRHL